MFLFVGFYCTWVMSNIGEASPNNILFEKFTRAQLVNMKTVIEPLRNSYEIPST